MRQNARHTIALRLTLTLTLTLLLCQTALCAERTSAVTYAQNLAVPFIRNYTAKEYGAHNRSMDVACDDYGTVFVANFEGLLYFDGSSWRKLHTPGISRITRLAKGSDGRIWAGGYNYFGYIRARQNGELELHSILSDNLKLKLGEVDHIRIDGKKVLFHTSYGKIFCVQSDNSVKEVKKAKAADIAADGIASVRVGKEVVSAINGEGLTIRDGRTTRVIDETQGLCSNSITNITYDGQHTIWGATNHGIFAVEYPSPYSHYTEAQGLRGEVYCIGSVGNTIYIGTLEGLYRVENGRVVPVPGMECACWQTRSRANGTISLSTSQGLYEVSHSGLKQITTQNTISAITDGNGIYYTGEMDGVYQTTASGQHTLIADIEKCWDIRKTGNFLQVKTMYNQKWSISLKPGHNRMLLSNTANVDEPYIDYTDFKGRRWLTDNEGKDLTAIGCPNAKQLTQWARPMSLQPINDIMCPTDNTLWTGGDFGAMICNLTQAEKSKQVHEPIYIRQVVIAGDSVIWGGYLKKDMSPVAQLKNIEISTDCHSMTVHFSTKTNTIICPVLYHFRINGGRWSPWSTEPMAQFNNMAYGVTIFEVEAMDLFGNVSDRATVKWTKAYPFYMRWWALLFYFVVAVMAVRSYMTWRTKRLEREKARLSMLVNERTSELSTALNDLQHAQDEMMRMERSATAGKLTQGLIDRILNPVNYINNFSKLTNGLANDLSQNINDEKHSMSADNYDDCQDILGMMHQNLSKIEEHGVNTTRMLRAMEALLNQKVGTMREVNLVPLCRQVVQVTAGHYKKDIAQYGIHLNADIPAAAEITIQADPEPFNNALQSLLANAMYAVMKKAQKSVAAADEPYVPEVTLRLEEVDATRVVITVHDNGIGIEQTILPKIFDPFFTTKTTGEAAGVGLYLVREIIQQHGGNIKVNSEKDHYTDFILSF